MMNQLSISIIVPVYNAEAQIMHCLESINKAAEGYENIELLIIDDGSTDNTVAIVHNFLLESNLDIKVFSKENGGVSSARNLGLAKCKGRWIMFVDADDTLTENAFHVLRNQLVRCHAHSGVLPMYSFEINNNNVRTLRLPDKTIEIKKLLNGVIGERSVYETTLCTVWNKVYNIQIITKYNIRFPEGIKIGEDFIFNSIYLQYVSLIRYIPIPLYRYNNFEGSAIGKFYEEYDRYIMAMDRAYLNLLTAININTLKTNKLRAEFIVDRWLYASSICVEAPIKLCKKIEVLQKWYKNIDQSMITEILSFSKNQYSVIASKYDSKVSLALCIISLLIKNRFYNIKKFFCKIKANIRK